MKRLKMECSNTSKKARDQYSSDARLLDEFEVSDQQSGNSFNYTKSVMSSSGEPVQEDKINHYLLKIQRGGFIQPFGCLLTVEETSFQIIAYSENCGSLLGLSEDSLLGCDARTLFANSSSHHLMAAASSCTISLTNPVMVISESTKRVFYAILHRVDVGILIDLEPTSDDDPGFPDRVAVEAQKLALSSISQLQTNSRGNISALCDTLAKFVKDLTEYDRVMVYKFHKDEHGEVVSEVKRPGLEPYLGLHYPATDIPQATRFLFLKNRVRMICDARANPARIVQNENLEKPLILGKSTLRAPHGCHAQYMLNMNSIASLVMAIIVNENGKMKLWGLVSCHHHAEPRYIPYPIRCACELIMQAFGSQLNLELQWEVHIAEKKILKTQVLLCDMVLRDAPFGIVSKSPNIMDLVKCDGAAFYYSGVCRGLGVTPTELQIKELTEWLIEYTKDLSVWSTDSLVDVGFPNASALNGICGVAIALITSKDVILWFRSASEKKVRWGGAKHHHTDEDDGELMHPRSSFKAFLEVVQNKSFLWETWEINAICSLQETMHRSFMGMEKESGTVVTNPEQNDVERETLTLVICEMDRMFETAIVPVFAVDLVGVIWKWNSRIADMTGLQASEAIGKSMVNEVIHDDSRAKFRHHLFRALQGEEDKNIELRMRNLKPEEQNDSIFIMANACAFRNAAKNIVWVWFVCQDITEEKIARAKLACMESDYRALTQCYSPMLPPLFISDENVRCCEWNASMEKLTGWKRSEVLGKVLPGEIFGGLCRLKSQDDATKLIVRFFGALCRKDDDEALDNKNDNGVVPFAFGFYNKEGTYIEDILTVNKRVDGDGKLIGCLCFLQDMSLTSSSRASASSSCNPIATIE